MSSLTDIIFLLLIFFMLTSSLVQIRVDLPEAEAKTVAPSDLIVQVMPDGSYKMNGTDADLRSIRATVAEHLETSSNSEKATLTIAAEKQVPWNKVSGLMKIANDLQCRAIIATQPLEK